MASTHMKKIFVNNCQKRVWKNDTENYSFLKKKTTSVVT